MSSKIKAEHDALLEAMLLAAGADGKVTKPELEAIFARIYAHPEFSTYEKDHLREAVERASHRVTGYASVQDACEAIASRLETITSRELAFRCAASVALVDHKADYRELKTLKALQDAFGLTESRIVTLFEQAEDDADAVPKL
ncbi:MAG: TerB family tellurite resistance protein [Myxococcales bacterium]